MAVACDNCAETFAPRDRNFTDGGGAICDVCREGQYSVRWFNGDEMTGFYMKASPEEAEHVADVLKDQGATEISVNEVDWLTFDQMVQEITGEMEHKRGAPDLTDEDWVEVYYALEYKTKHGAAVGDKNWIGHLQDIMGRISQVKTV